MNALPPSVTEHLEEVRALCEKYRVKRLSLFGSAVKGTFDPERSDLDFVVEFLTEPDPLRRGEYYLDLLLGLQQLFTRDVDLVVGTSITNVYFRQVLDLTACQLYDAA
ncbi:MAG TPA: nucleotidyltransferase domain-containing protein [Thermoanaerobaculia bacterium]|jgi:predicted nucleotidyltransferase|nr:nucleotidyltransferase domain-containing protein [Thermoanaerobaculia bacterium]